MITGNNNAYLIKDFTVVQEGRVIGFNMKDIDYKENAMKDYYLHLETRVILEHCSYYSNQ